MKKLVSLQQYMMRHFMLAIFAVMTIWALLFYAYILEEVYDNVDDGLRDQKITILRSAYEDPSILKLSTYGVNQFRIHAAKGSEIDERNNFSHEFFYMPYDDEDEPYRVLRTMFYGPDKLPYHLEIRASTVERDDLIIDLSTALFVLYVAVVLGIFFLLKYRIFRTAWKPFYAILKDLNAYEVGTTANVAAVDTEVQEFNNLQQHVASMIARNAAVFADQKLFIENASHELQTPLAITVNKIDLIMDDSQTPPSLLIKLSETKSALQRLIDLNRSLLILSRIENRQFVQTQQVDINKITSELLENLNEIAVHKGVHIHADFQHHLIVTGNLDLLTMALSNLIRNAIRYTQSGGEIQIEIVDNAWQIRNSSATGALPESYIYNRFYKGSDAIQSSGLGLSLVKSILDITPGGGIAYFFEQNFHQFSVTFDNS
ncbi:sensor histidine kinase [Sphingobacterium corticis]|uniref:histidine kinase n=1 Tax=Sphingobacterium corticis TaxID=1812823 RepID=A0ABW5NG38_9SPHI